MVHSYIDTEFSKYFLTTLIKGKPYSKEWEAIQKIRKNFINTNLNFKSDIFSMLEGFNETEKDLLQRIFFNELTTGRGNNELNFKVTRPFNLLRKSNVYKQLKLPFANFWLNGKIKYSIEEYENHNPYLFFNTENIEEKCFLIDVIKKWVVTPNPNPTNSICLTNWSEIGKYKHNYFDIIISDRYCLNDEVGIKENIPYIIKNLSSNHKAIKNILIFVREENVISENLEKAHKIIVKELSDMNIHNFNLKIYGSKNTGHDRVIITNSFYLSSGDSFNYFNNKGKKNTNTTQLEILSISKYYDLVNQHLINLKKIYNSENKTTYGTISDDNLLSLYQLN
ncbi:MAG: hypothetical protein KGV44_01060 [Flavobacteriaceae bacterium]|nr:hypothetical protein [Flavobacteriaceae bacterium]